jgi:hypothetical protein
MFPPISPSFVTTEWNHASKMRHLTQSSMLMFTFPSSLPVFEMKYKRLVHPPFGIPTLSKWHSTQAIANLPGDCTSMAIPYLLP